MRIRRSRGDFHRAVAEARRTRQGLAAGKLGFSEQAWLLYPSLVLNARSHRQRAALFASLRVHAYRQGGVFPDSDDSQLDFCERFRATCIDMDFLAASAGWPEALELLPDPGPELVDVEALEPDRSHPYDSANCYLPSLRGARVLLVSSLADALAERATRATFESVWANIGVPWFEPGEVDALQFPYTYDESVQATHQSIWDIYDDVVSRMASREFDVALIAAAALGCPLATAVKKMGVVGISLGGHLQVLFGVHGKRWRDDHEWSSRYINESWIGVPEEMRPTNSQGLADDGAYW